MQTTKKINLVKVRATLGLGEAHRPRELSRDEAR